ncbi:aldo/keto reductase [Nitrosomonadales bacterium]|nr:aldo/keto reductase [Nitrosomonadales bacterium]
MFEKKDYRKVAHTELRVSPITLGTMTFGDQNSQKEAFDQLDFVLDQGINSFDVAEMYPVPPKPETCNATEIIIGNWVQNKKRDELILSTKIAGPRRSIDWIRGGPKSLDDKNISEAVNNSLRRMKTDYVDLLYLHWPERNVPMFGQYKFEPNDEYKNNKKIEWVSIEEQLESLTKLVDDGKVRYIALSNEYPWGVMEFIKIAKEKKLPLICAVQNGYSLINRIAELGLSEILYREGLGFFAYSPLGFGHLTGKYIQDPEASGRVNLFPGYAKRYTKPGVTLAVEDYLHIAKEANLSLTQMALSFAYRQWFVTSTIVGATSMNQLKENIAAYEIILKDDILKKIDQVHLTRMNPAP